MITTIHAIFHSFCAAENFCKSHNIEDYTIIKNEHDICYTLYYKIDIPEEKEPEPEDEKTIEMRQFIIGLLVGFLEDKCYKREELEKICVEVSKFYPNEFEYIDIY